MEVIILCTFAVSGSYYEVHAPLYEDPMLSTRDVIEPLEAMWPTKITEVNYIVEEERKIYSIEIDDIRHDQKDFLNGAIKSDHWIVKEK